jgi:hypothetical protein
MNLVERVKNIILTPNTEWPVIDRETGDTGFLFKNYVAILAAIPAVCGFIGTVILGAGLRVGLTFSLLSAIIGYVLAFVASYLMALIVNALAPSFSGRSDFPSALKLVVYSSTAAWLAGVFSLIPALAILGILGLYSLYLLYLGVPVLMKTPPEKAMVYTIVVIVCAIVMWIVIAAIPGFLLLGFLI